MAFSGSEWKTVQVLYRDTSIDLLGIHTGFCRRGEGEAWALASSAISNTSFVVTCICSSKSETDRHTHTKHTHNTLWHNIEHTDMHILYILTLKWAGTMPLSHEDNTYMRVILMKKIDKNNVKIIFRGWGKSHLYE